MAEKLEDFNLPNSVVQKIIKEAIVDNINIGKDARVALARAAAVFVLYITSHSSQMAQKVNRKTLIGQDVLDALQNLEFDELIQPLKQSLSEYNDGKKKKDKTSKSKKPDDEEEDDVVEEIEEDIDDENDDD